MHRFCLEPARLDRDAAGTPVSILFDDVYHSSDGGPGQAEHVFLGGNELPARWSGLERFVILETGFGTGLNFLSTWSAWRNDPQRPRRLHYLAVEKHPFGRDDLARLHARWPQFQEISAALQRDWPHLLPGFHRLEFESGRVVLTLMFGEAEALLKRLAAKVDAFYLDGFDPKKNPAMWSPQLMRQLMQLAAPGSSLATWCVAAPVREALRQAGFVTGKRRGYGRKREMLVGRAPGETKPAPRAADRHAVILGAGLAGCALAERLAGRGWRVDLIERHAGPAQEGSGNLAGIVRPLLSRDDNIASRLNRACYLHTLRAWSSLDRRGQPLRRGMTGVLQIARDAEHEAQQRDMAADWPREYVSFLERDQAGEYLGAETLFGGWWFPDGGWAHPPGAAQSWLAAAGERVRLLPKRSAAAVDWTGRSWQVMDAGGVLIAETPTLILASGVGLRTLPQVSALPLRVMRGQVTHIPAGKLPDLAFAACCEGYLTPAVDGLHCLGASYTNDEGSELRSAETHGNLGRLARILPGCDADLDRCELDGRVGFRAITQDRLPIIGALPGDLGKLPSDLRLDHVPRLPGLYGLLGLGSRGLVWAALAAETLACQLEDEPLPMETDLIAAVDPARFALRAHRRGFA